MTRSGGTHAERPSAATANRWDFSFGKPLLFRRQVSRRKFHPVPIRILAIDITRKETLINLVVRFIDRWSAASVKPRAISAERDVPGCAERIEVRRGCTEWHGINGAEDGPARFQGSICGR